MPTSNTAAYPYEKVIFLTPLKLGHTSACCYFCPRSLHKSFSVKRDQLIAKQDGL